MDGKGRQTFGYVATEIQATKEVRSYFNGNVNKVYTKINYTRESKFVWPDYRWPPHYHSW